MVCLCNNPLRFIDPTGLWKYEVDPETGEAYAVAESYDDDGDGKIDRYDTLWGLSEEYYGAGTYYNKLANDNNIKDPDNIQIGQRVKMSDYNNQGKKSRTKILKQGYILGSYNKDTLDDLQKRFGLDLRLSNTEQALYDEIWGAKFTLAQEKGDVEALVRLLEQRFSGFKYDPNKPTPLVTQFFASQQGDPVPIMVGVSVIYFSMDSRFKWI